MHYLGLDNLAVIRFCELDRRSLEFFKAEAFKIFSQAKHVDHADHHTIIGHVDNARYTFYAGAVLAVGFIQLFGKHVEHDNTMTILPGAYSFISIDIIQCNLLKNQIRIFLN